MYTILAIAFYMVFFNLQRIGLKVDLDIGLSNTTYTLLLVIALTLLASPNLSSRRYIVLLAIVGAVYVAIDVVPSKRIAPLDSALNLGVLAMALAVMVSLSKSVLRYEEDVRDLVIDPDNVQVLPYYIGERRVNQEILRLQRVGRPLSIVYCLAVDDAFSTDLMEITDDTIGAHIDEMILRRKFQVQLMRALLSLSYKSDIVVQHGDAIMVCLSEASAFDAQRFIERLSLFVASDVNAKLLVGTANFPEAGNTFDQLVHVARGQMREMVKSTSDTESRRRNGEVLVEMVKRLEIEKQSAWLNTLTYQSSSAKAIYRPIKRLMDIAISLVMLPVVLLVFVGVGLAIYLDDRGPIFYWQDRTGFGGRRFRMMKFRTMVVNAPALQPHKIIGEDGHEIFSWPDKDEDDPRITRIGRILRKTSLDEVPQLFSVLKGDMSLVGPRPTSWDVSMYTLHQTERLTVAPGITGLWQVSARESKNPDERLLWDLKYVEKMSLGLDIQILWRTAMQVVKKGGV